MAGLRVWLRSHVRSALRKLSGKSRQPKQQESKNFASARDLNISAPISVRHDGDTFAPSTAEPAFFPSIQEVDEPNEAQHHRHGVIDLEVPDYSDTTMQLAMPNLSFTTLVEEVEAPPSLHDDSDADTIPGDIMPVTPSSSQRTSRRWSVIQGLGSLPGYPTMTIASRPQSYTDSNVSTTHETNRSSFYSFTTRDSSIRDSPSRPWSIVHGLSSLPGYPTMTIASRPQSCITNSNISTTREGKRLSFYSFTSRDGSIRKSTGRPRSIVHGLSSLSGYPSMNLTSRPQSFIDDSCLETRPTNRSSVYSGIDGKNSTRNRRASMPNRRSLVPSKRGSWRGQPIKKRTSVMSDSSTYSGSSRRFSRWNWDLETYEIHTNPYAPV